MSTKLWRKRYLVAWKARRRAAGYCAECYAKPAGETVRCESCREKHNNQEREPNRARMWALRNCEESAERIETMLKCAEKM